MTTVVPLDPEQDPRGATTVLARIGDVATGQVRIEALLADIRRDLCSLSASVEEVMKAQRAGHLSKEQEVRDPLKAEESETESEEEEQEGKVKEVKTGQSERGARKLSTAQATAIRTGQSNVEDEQGEVPATLPGDWPASVAVRAEMSSCRSVASVHRKHDATVVMAMGSDGHADAPSAGSTARMVVVPNSGLHSAYSMVSFLVLMKDVLILPYILAWDVQMEGFLLALGFASCTFWTVDIGISFVSGSMQHGRVEVAPFLVARRYARSWLLPDLMLVCADWLGLALALSSWKDLAPLRAVQAMRLLGLARTVKVLPRLQDDFTMTSLSDGGRISLTAILIVCATLIVNHLFGCAWYAIGRTAPSDTGMRWIDLSTNWNGEEIPFLASGPVHQYITSFHWSIAQFTLGAMDVAAHNSIERAFGILCLAVGLVFGTSLVSILSAGMVSRQTARDDQIQLLRKLRRFLREHGISRHVAALAQQQAKERLAIRPRLQEEDVPALQLLSRDLRAWLRIERFQDNLKAHGLFRLWVETDCRMARELCLQAVESCALRPHDELFGPGESSGKAHCLVSGHARYTQRPETAPVHCSWVRSVVEGHWLCEAALWSHWLHVGALRASSRCEVLSLSAEGTAKVLARHPLLSSISVEYCKAFHRRLVQSHPPSAPWPDDLEVPLTDYSDVVVSMSRTAQAAVGALALDCIQGRRSGQAARLRQEVEENKCALLVNAQGQVMRVVSIVLLHMEDAQGRILVELGRLDACTERAEASGNLPAAKQQAGEALGTAYARLLQKFGLQREHVQLEDVQRQVEWKDSKAYGVSTKYLRTVHRVRLLHRLPLPVLPKLHEMRVTGTLSERSGSSSEPPSELLSAPTYEIQSAERSDFYAWLEAGTFEQCSTPAMQRQLESLLTILGELSTRHSTRPSGSVDTSMGTFWRSTAFLRGTAFWRDAASRRTTSRIAASRDGAVSHTFSKNSAARNSAVENGLFQETASPDAALGDAAPRNTVAGDAAPATEADPESTRLQL